ncbi:hypothetical protein ACFL09_06535 [Planctomycetota bacterium]
MAAQSPPDKERPIRRSDVVFMYDNPKRYEAYGCTVLGWAGWRKAKHIEQAHAKGVRRFSCSVGFLTEFKGAIDFDPNFLDAACRNFAGEPFIVPWLWDHKHKGKPAYWWCTNSPLYRRYLLSRLEQAMKVKPDGLHIDDYRGTSGSITWLEGGFCRHCMAAFRGYLKKNVPTEKLTKLGIVDLEAFDYRKFLVDRGVKPGDYKKRRARLPLADEFYHFQVMANNAWVAEYRKRAQELRGQPVGLSVNSGANNPHAIVIAPELDNFCCEVGHGAAKRRPATHPVYIYKIGDGLDRPICSTASGHDWAFVHEHKVYGLVRSWTALSYAFGHTLMAPHRQWCYTKEKGTHWTDGPTEEYAWLYRWVHDNARLFDRYEAAAPVAVVYSNLANRKGRGKIEGLCVDLARANVPYTVVMAGDDWLPDHRLTKRQLDRFKAVVMTKTCELDARQQKLIDGVKADGRLVTWPDKAALAKLIGTPVAIEGATQVWAVPRAIPGDRKAPVMVHLLNRNYDAKNDAVVPQKGLALRLRRDLFGGRKLAKATLHAPKTKPVALELAADRQHTTVGIPELGLWAIIELDN